MFFQSNTVWFKINTLQLDLGFPCKFLKIPNKIIQFNYYVKFGEILSVSLAAFKCLILLVKLHIARYIPIHPNQFTRCIYNQHKLKSVQQVNSKNDRKYNNYVNENNRHSCHCNRSQNRFIFIKRQHVCLVIMSHGND